jgi:tetratricopeptide (TPR) repeat protein
MANVIKYNLSILAVAILAGCSNTKEPTAKETAMKNWNDARATVMVGLASDQYQNANFDKSRATIDQALSMAPQNAAAHILSAKLYIETGSLEAAERELALARKCDPNSAEADYLLGIVYQRWQQPQLALEFYQYACDKAPAELAYVMAKAEMQVAMGRRDEALAMLQAKAAYFEHSGEIRDEIGLLLQQENRRAEAVEMFRHAEVLAGDDLTIKEHLAMALFHDGQYAEAGSILTDLLTNAKYDHRVDLLEVLGECQLQTGHAGDAVQSFQAASDLKPDTGGAWHSLARAELQIGNLRRAEFALRKCLSIDDEDADGHMMMGYAQLRLGEFAAGYSSFARASELNPKDTTSLCMMGLALDRMGRNREAAECYRRALRIAPGDDLASRLLARLDVR